MYNEVFSVVAKIFNVSAPPPLLSLWKQELLLLGCVSRRWTYLIEHLMSVSYDSVTTSEQYHDLSNLLAGSGRYQTSDCREETISSKVCPPSLSLAYFMLVHLVLWCILPHSSIFYSVHTFISQNSLLVLVLQLGNWHSWIFDWTTGGTTATVLENIPSPCGSRCSILVFMCFHFVCFQNCHTSNCLSHFNDC